MVVTPKNTLIIKQKEGKVNMKKEFKDYYLGLDMGTDSVGWAVTDLDYNVLKFNRKAMWGIRLFEKGETAEDRRLHRSARRRLQRKEQRIDILQELFSEAINKVDPGLHHILKKRGHFLFEGQNMQSIANFANAYHSFCQVMKDEMNIQFKEDAIDEIEKILKQKKISKTVKQEQLNKLMGATEKNEMKKRLFV